jgi:ubiquinone/menaquinone biosynthesis C-methylase UbiE
MKKAYKGLGMEGPVARWYAANTLRSVDEYRKLAREVARGLPPGSSVLEVAPGPGYFAVELARLGDYRVTGLDISRTFVEIARRNAEKAGVQADFQVGDAAAMPFADGAFDFLLCRAAFKNFADPGGALREMRRVLAPGGEARIIDLRRDASRESLAEEVRSLRLTPVNSLITSLTFRFMLLPRAYTRADFERMLEGAGFRSHDIRESRIGLELRLRS